MKDKDFISSALKVIEIELNAVKSLTNQIKSDFEDLCSNILNAQGKLILMGIGKSGHIAQKISATYQVLVLHPFLYIQLKLPMVI